MILNIFLIVIGLLTSAIGIWNIFVGSYVWGTIFGLGGIWSIWLGTLYIIQDKEETQRRLALKEKQERQTQAFHMPVDEGILTDDLFNINPETDQMIRHGQESNQMLSEVFEIIPNNQNVIHLEEFMENSANEQAQNTDIDRRQDTIERNLNVAVKETQDLTELSKHLDESNS